MPLFCHTNLNMVKHHLYEKNDIRICDNAVRLWFKTAE